MKPNKRASFVHHCTLALLAGLVLLDGCYQQTVYRLPSGMTYQVWHRSSGIPAGGGATVKARYVERHKDSMIADTSGELPLYQELIPGLVFPYTPGEALGGAMVGDSIVFTRKVSEMKAKGLLKALPHGWHRSDELVGTMVVERVFPYDVLHGDSLLHADKLAEARRLLEAATAEGRKRMKDWLAQRGLSAMEIDTGVYRLIDQQGTGATVDSGAAVALRYRLTTLSGHVINSNMDTAFHQPPVLNVLLGTAMLPPVVDKALRGQPRGSKLRIFLPRGLGIDPQTVVQQGKVPPDDVIWQLEVK